MALLVYLLIFIPLLMGIAIYAFDQPRISQGVYAMQAVLSGIVFGFLIPHLLTNNFKATVFVGGGWSKLVGVAFKIDGLSVLFVTMTTLAFWYIWLYILPKQLKDHKYLFFLCMLESALFGLFTTDDLFAIFILIELITIIAALMVTYKKDAHAVRAGLFYLMYSSWGMLLYLLGIICLYWYTGNMNIDLVVYALPEYAHEPVVATALAAMLTGLGLKSGFFMLHFWLPQAHSAAPANISAILSSLIAKMGLFAMLRITGLLTMPSTSHFLLLVGIISGLLGALFAMLQSDMKRILAYHTVSQLGLIFIGFGLLGSKNAFGAYAHLFNHFTFKSLLFLTVGLVIAETGERRVKKLHGIWYWNRPVAICLSIGIFSIMGFPLSSASFSKLLIKSGEHLPLVTTALYIINLGTVISFIKLGSTLFGKPSEALLLATQKNQHTYKALYFVSFLTLVALPIELWLSATYKPEILSYYLKKFPTDVLTFSLTYLTAYLVYRFGLLKLIKKHPHLGHGDVSFGHAVLSSVAVFLGLLIYLVPWS